MSIIQQGSTSVLAAAAGASPIQLQLPAVASGNSLVVCLSYGNSEGYPDSVSTPTDTFGDSFTLINSSQHTVPPSSGLVDTSFLQTYIWLAAAASSGGDNTISVAFDVGAFTNANFVLHVFELSPTVSSDVATSGSHTTFDGLQVANSLSLTPTGSDFVIVNAVADSPQIPNGQPSNGSGFTAGLAYRAHSNVSGTYDTIDLQLQYKFTSNPTGCAFSNQQPIGWVADAAGLKQAPPVLTSIVVTPSAAAILAGGTQVFAAQGIDQYGDPIAATFAWHSNNTTVAPIAGSTALGAAVGVANITATSGAVTSNIAVLTVLQASSATLNVSSRYALTKQGVGTVNVTYPDSGNIVARQAAGQASVKLVDATQQQATDALVVAPDANFLASSTGKGLVPTANPAQQTSAGKSLAPEHE